MKIISFGKVEILPALLDKSCSQTIRPAWKKIKRQLPYDGEGYSEGQIDLQSNEIISKPPRFKVGEEVKLMWNQGSKYKWFCLICGKSRPKENKKCEHCGTIVAMFNKNLGIVKITEVFKIEMSMNPIHIVKIWDSEGDRMAGNKRISYDYMKNVLAKKDGFKSSQDMFTLLDKMYDLSTPKEFWVYRWKWQKG